MAGGNFQAAIVDYVDAIRLAPEDGWNYLMRANAYTAAGDPHAAIADYAAAVRLDPGYALAYFRRGEAWPEICSALCQ
jgi:tetratricopeptide (TPR) repeat protein